MVDASIMDGLCMTNNVDLHVINFALMKLKMLCICAPVLPDPRDYPAAVDVANGLIRLQVFAAFVVDPPVGEVAIGH